MTGEPQGRIFHLGSNGALTELAETPFSLEDHLQGLLEAHPDLLPGDQIDPEEARRWLLVAREMAVPGETTSWALDHLYVDQDGIPTLVEVKKGSNPELRRKVVGQMLDYAANAPIGWPARTLRARYEERCSAASLDPDVELKEALGDGLEPEGFWRLVEENLAARRIRLLFVTDRMVPELRRVVEFLNQSMAEVEVLAVEIRRYSGLTGATLVPSVFGRTLASEERKPSPGKGETWTEARFLQDLEKNKGLEAREIAERLLSWSRKQTPEIWWGRGKKLGSFGPVFLPETQRIYPFLVWTNGSVELQFQWLANRPPFDEEQERLVLLGRLNEILGLQLPPNAIGRRPSFPLAFLANDERRSAFEQACLEVAAKVRLAEEA